MNIQKTFFTSIWRSAVVMQEDEPGLKLAHSCIETFWPCLLFHYKVVKTFS